MITVSIAGGSQPEILELVKKSQEKFGNQIAFVVFDKSDNLGSETDWTYVHCQDDYEVAKAAVSYVASGKAQILLKGIIPTHVVLKEVLQKEHQLKTSPVLSHVAMVTLANQQGQFLLTDCAMNITPDKEALIKIIDNATTVAHKIGIEKPKIALLSAAENINPKMPSSVMAAELTDYFSESTDKVVYGPLSLDLAVSKESAEHKRFTGPIIGDADVLVVPTIDVGNTLYKSLTLFAGALIGGTIVGTKVPVVLTSRSDSTATKLHSLEFALKQVVS